VSAAATVTAFAGICLLAITWLLVPAVADSGFQDALAASGGPREEIVVSVRFDPEASAEVAERVRRTVANHPDIASGVANETWSSAFTTEELRGQVRVALGAHSNVSDSASLLTGRWPEAGNEPIELTVHAEAVETLNVAVGDVIVLEPLVGDGVPLPATIVGTFQPSDPADGSLSRYGTDPEGDGTQITTVGPVVADLQDVAHMLDPRATTSTWIVDLRLDDVTFSEARLAVDSLTALATELAQAASSTEASSTGNQPIVRQPTEVIEKAEAAASAARSMILIVASLLALLALWALWFTARLLAARRAAVTALLRARGVGRGRLLRMSIGGQAFPAVAIAVTVPFVAVTMLSSFPDRGLAAVGATSDIELWAVTAVAAACWVVLVVATDLRVGRSIAQHSAESARPSRTSAAQRAGADVVVLVLGVVALLQLRRPPGEVPDVVVVLAPAVCVLAGTLIIIRCLPWLGRGAWGIGARGRGAAGVLGTFEISRRTGRHAAATSLVLVAVAVAVFTATTHSTWVAAREGVVDLAEPADLRAGHNAASDAEEDGARFIAEQLEQLPGVDAVMPVHRMSSAVRGGRLDVVGIDPDVALQVVRWPEHVVGGHAATLIPLLQGGDRERLALITQPYADKHGYQVGDSMTVQAAGQSVSFDVAAIVNAVPGSVSADAVLTDVDTILRGFGRSEPSEWWISTSEPGTVSDAVAQLDGIVVAPWVGPGVEQPRSATAAMFAGLAVGLAVAALFLLIGVGAHAVANTRARVGEQAIVNALGLARATAVIAVAIEQALVLAFATVMGLGVGGLVASLAVPEIVGPLAGLPEWLPIPVIHSAQVIVVLVGGMAGLVGLVTISITIAFRRMDVAAALRAGERR
jgi:hypothetical protein